MFGFPVLQQQLGAAALAAAPASAAPVPVGAHGKYRKAAKRALCPSINKKLIQAADSGDVRGLFCCISEYLPDMNLVNMTTSLHRLAKLTSDSPAAREFLTDQASQTLLGDLLTAIADALIKSDTVLNDSRRQALSNVIWSLGVMRCVQLRLVQITVNLAHQQLRNFRPFEIVSTVWAFAKLGSLHPAVRDMVAPLQLEAVASVSAVLDKLGFRFMAMAAWALVASGTGDAVLLSRLAGKMLPSIARADCLPNHLVDTAWAFSSVGFRHERVLLEVANKARCHIGSFSLAEMSALCQTLAAEGISCAGLTTVAPAPWPAPLLPLARGHSLRAAAPPRSRAEAPPQAPVGQAFVGEYTMAMAGGAPGICGAPQSPAQHKHQPQQPRHLQHLQQFQPSPPLPVPVGRIGLQGMDGVQAFCVGRQWSAVTEDDPWGADCVEAAMAEGLRATDSTTASVLERAAEGEVSETGSIWSEDYGSDPAVSPDARVRGFATVPGSRTTLLELSPGGEHVRVENIEQRCEAMGSSPSEMRQRYNVKNTFLEIDEEGAEDEEVRQKVSQKLRPAMDIALLGMPREELDSLRLRYQMARDL